MKTATAAARYDRFYFSVPKDPEAMSLDELRQEADSAERSFDMARECQNGISTKEWMRYRNVQAQFGKLGHFRPTWS